MIRSHDAPAAACAACGSRVKTLAGTRDAASAAATAAPLCVWPAASRTQSGIASLTASKQCPLILGSRRPRLLLVRLGFRVYPTEGTGEAAAEAERGMATRNRRRLGSTATFRVGGKLDRLPPSVVTRAGAVAPIAEESCFYWLSPSHAGVLLGSKVNDLFIYNDNHNNSTSQNPSRFKTRAGARERSSTEAEAEPTLF